MGLFKNVIIRNLLIFKEKLFCKHQWLKGIKSLWRSSVSDWKMFASSTKSKILELLKEKMILLLNK